MHTAHFFPRGGFFADGFYGIWTNPYFWVPKLIGLALLIVGFVLLYRAIKKRRNLESSASDEAIQMLKMQFVNEEIDEETYLKKLALLK